MTPFFRRNLICFVAAALVTAVLMRCYLSISPAVDLKMLYILFHVRGPRPVPQTVSLIRGDKRSYDRLGMKRGEDELSYLAQAIERAKSSGAKLVILDYFFANKAKDSVINERLQKALASVPTVIGQSGTFYTDTDLDGKQRESLERILPDRMFAESAGEVVWLLARLGNEVVSRLSLSEDTDHPNLEAIPLLRPLHKFISPGIRKPGDYDLINFYGEPYGIPDVPLYRVVSDEEPVPDAFFKDRVVLIGAVDLPWSRDGKDDTVPISASKVPMWGVEMHATVVANLLDGSWIRRLSPNMEAKIAAAILFPLVFVAFSFGLYWGVVLTAIVFQLWWILALYSFMHWLFFVPGAGIIFVAMPVVLFVLVFPAACDVRRFMRKAKKAGQQ